MPCVMHFMLYINSYKIFHNASGHESGVDHAWLVLSLRTTVDTSVNLHRCGGLPPVRVHGRAAAGVKWMCDALFMHFMLGIID